MFSGSSCAEELLSWHVVDHLSVRPSAHMSVRLSFSTSHETIMGLTSKLVGSIRVVRRLTFVQIVLICYPAGS